jgi:hypothetical protein
MTITTKETPSALQDLLKAKGNSKEHATVHQTTVAVELPNEAPATPDLDPNADEPALKATPDKEQEPVDPRDSQVYRDFKQYHDTEVHQLRLQLQERDRLIAESQKPALKAPKTPEELAKFKEQFPEAYDNIKSLILETLSDDSLDINRQAKEVLQAQAKLREEQAFSELKKLHPDAEEIKKDPKFATWYHEQSADIQRVLATSTDSKAISKLLTLYKMEVGIPTEKEKKKIVNKENEDASLAVKVKGQSEISPQKKIWTGTEIRDISAPGNYKRWLKLREEIDTARREGRVDYSK